MAACSSNVDLDATRVVDLFSVFFQVRDDVMNLDSGEVCEDAILTLAYSKWASQYAAQKGFAEDLTEGKFSYPVVHSITTSRSQGFDEDAEQLLCELLSLPLVQ